MTNNREEPIISDDPQENLCPDTLKNVFTFFNSPLDLCKQQLVCKEWQLNASSDDLWTELLTKDEVVKKTAVANISFGKIDPPTLSNAQLFKQSRQVRAYKAELARIRDILAMNESLDLIDKNGLHPRLAIATCKNQITLEEALIIQLKLDFAISMKEIQDEQILLLNSVQVQGLKEDFTVVEILHPSFASENPFESSCIERTKNLKALQADWDDFDRNGGCILQ